VYPSLHEPNDHLRPPHPAAGPLGSVVSRETAAGPPSRRAKPPILGRLFTSATPALPRGALSPANIAQKEHRGPAASTAAVPATRRQPADRTSGEPLSRRLASITLDNLDDLPPKCRRCVFWELDPVNHARAVETGEPGLEKESWVSSVLLEWGSCGKLIYVDGVPAGYILYAPPQYVPRSIAFPTSPVSADAVLLMTASVVGDFAGGGLGRMLVQGVAKDLTRRGVKAVEAFGDLKWQGMSCVVPADYLLAVGFKTVRPHAHYPRLRLELKTALSWREDVEVALERLLGSMSPERSLRLA
jgi:hypothetical protein